MSNALQNILVISSDYPQPNIASGELRFYTLLSLLSQKYHVLFFALNVNDADHDSGSRMEQAGITLCKTDLPHALKHFKPDIVWFEYYYQVCEVYIELLDHYCPGARIVVDSVDVHYNRLEAYARLTGKSEDQTVARQIKERELAVYALADMVLAVSEDDRRLIHRELPNLAVAVVPNLHDVPRFPDPAQRRYGELVFVGGFNHSPNVDAMLYFKSEVMPLITAVRPQVRLTIIGSNAPAEILALASEHISVLGYVPETAPFLKSAYISVAPLRYGGGMKGKVGEAMSYGLPVVTTSFGAEGFGLLPGKDLLIGDSPESFSQQVLALLDDVHLYSCIARNGYDFIQKHYSIPVVALMLASSLEQLKCLPPRKIGLARRMTLFLKYSYARHVAWRLSN
jgi:glycosyltransferase involved in cell wall biosynthesis